MEEEYEPYAGHGLGRLLSLGGAKKSKGKNKYYRNYDLLFHGFIPSRRRERVPGDVQSGIHLICLSEQSITCRRRLGVETFWPCGAPAVVFNYTGMV